MTLNRQELERSILQTRKKIEELINRENETADHREKENLRRKRKELHILQLWNLNQFRRLDD